MPPAGTTFARPRRLVLQSCWRTAAAAEPADWTPRHQTLLEILGEGVLAGSGSDAVGTYVLDHGIAWENENGDTFIKCRKRYQNEAAAGQNRRWKLYVCLTPTPLSWGQSRAQCFVFVFKVGSRRHQNVREHHPPYTAAVARRWYSGRSERPACDGKHAFEGTWRYDVCGVPSTDARYSGEWRAEEQ